jgi:pimeloyl-ACP methyl ester carboxylesterase
MLEAAVGRPPIWVGYENLAAGKIGRLRLAANGIDPGPPDGRHITALGPLPDYYALPLTRLSQLLIQNGYTLNSYGYDWRVDARRSGQFLAADIMLDETAEDPCTIVGHSFGGLVARFAWQRLVGAGQTGLVRRIITLGTPHWGCYASVDLFQGGSEQLTQIVNLNYAPGLAGLGISPPSGNRTWHYSDLVALACTFPSFYNVMPSLLAPHQESDPNRAKLFSGPWPASIPVQIADLQDMVNVFQPALAGADTMPPPWVLTTVAGVGMPTPDRLDYPSALGQLDSVNRFNVGDGYVPPSSALLAGSAQYTLNVAHEDLPGSTIESGQLVQWILDPRGPPSPAPPAVVVPGPLVQSLAGPPSPVRILVSAPIPRDP